MPNREASCPAGAALAALEEACGTTNLLKRIVGVVEQFATLGGISDTLRRVFGEQQAECML